MRLIAPAKINWTLEVLGRPDSYRGYHEVRSVMQTIDLCDEVRLEPAEKLTLVTAGEHAPPEDDLTMRAACELAEAAGQHHGATISLRKRIPAAAGLGGGSSDAAAVLRGLNRMWGLGLGRERLAEIAARIGSDVAFFIYGGTALAAGRGERITPLPDAPVTWLVVLVPPLTLAEKTKRMYAALTAADPSAGSGQALRRGSGQAFGDGSRSEALAGRIADGEPVEDGWLCNSFERAAYESFSGLASYRDALLAAGARRAHVAGSGPALFALAGSEGEARAIRRQLPTAGGGDSFLARTMTAGEALVVEE